jgi:hypothetical protein
MQIPRILRSALACGALAASGLAYAQTATDSNSALLAILVRKGILTADEAAQIQKEAAAQAAATAAAQPAPTTMAPMAPTAPMESAGAGGGSAPAPAAMTSANTGKSPLSFKIGIADFTPFGFVDMTAIYRGTEDGGDIGSSFGSIPYSNTAGGQLSETRFSAKNSRFGLRVDSMVNDYKVLGYAEADFLGNAATNLNVASNSDTFRMRVYFLDVRKGPWEILAGQDWSMMTPDRHGLGVVPSDVFYTQNEDTNYQVGLVWGRTPQFRAMFHASDEWTMGVSLENPDQYVGSAVTLPTGFTTTEVDNGSNGTATPNTFPDTIGKVAYDTTFAGMPFHADVAGMLRFFKINTYTAAINANSTATGYAGSANAFLTVLPNLTLIGNVFDGNGGGRYLSTGLGPDFIVNPVNASGVYTLSLINSYAGLGGAEWDVLPATKLSAYYGSVNYGRKTGLNLNGTIGGGYGYVGSSNSNNKNIEEYTLDLTQTLWKNPSYGDLKLILQYSYLDRTPWFVATGSPSSAHMNMFYLDLRYDLP